jgi:hypothetical protein
MLEHAPRSAGVLHWPLLLRPQHRTPPSLRSAMVWKAPPAMLEHAPRSAGVLHWPSPLAPQHRTTPSACALRSIATIPAVARNAATSPDFARSGPVRPVYFDCAMAFKGTSAGTGFQQLSRISSGSCRFLYPTAGVSADTGLGRSGAVSCTTRDSVATKAHRQPLE